MADTEEEALGVNMSKIINWNQTQNSLYNFKIAVLARILL